MLGVVQCAVLPGLLEQLVYAHGHVARRAVGSAETAGGDEGSRWSDQYPVAVVTGQQQGLDGGGIVDVGVVDADEHFAAVENPGQTAQQVALLAYLAGNQPQPLLACGLAPERQLPSLAKIGR